MIEAAQYHITTESVMLSRDEEPTISGMTGKQFQRRLMNLLTTDPAETGGFPEAPLAYDAVWAVALAFNCTLSKLRSGRKLEDFTYNNTAIAKKLFTCVKDTQFRGVSGQVMFNDLGDRIARTQIEQLQDGKYQILGFYDTTTLRLDWYGKEKFATVNGLPPPDSTLIMESLLAVDLEVYLNELSRIAIAAFTSSTLPVRECCLASADEDLLVVTNSTTVACTGQKSTRFPQLYYAIAVLAAIGIFVACTIFIFNFKNSEKTIIMQSQPQCNNILLVGCILCSLSLLLLGLPARGITIPKHSFTLLCHVCLFFANHF
ncbi:unnamed protein product [Gongylonema pulchrum]|uniref:ANF_receptor domain-containing protein n=1 Tax=Gongylonema pulchrum TaxID=637853 RepID=A0A183CUU9_9BILA|nr:unnamed protein product [Gongylonema pulchrum]